MNPTIRVSISARISGIMKNMEAVIIVTGSGDRITAFDEYRLLTLLQINNTKAGIRAVPIKKAVLKKDTATAPATIIPNIKTYGDLPFLFDATKHRKR